MPSANRAEHMPATRLCEETSPELRPPSDCLQWCLPFVFCRLISPRSIWSGFAGDTMLGVLSRKAFLPHAMPQGSLRCPRLPCRTRHCIEAEMLWKCLQVPSTDLPTVKIVTIQCVQAKQAVRSHCYCHYCHKLILPHKLGVSLLSTALGSSGDAQLCTDISVCKHSMHVTHKDVSRQISGHTSLGWALCTLVFIEWA